MEKGVKLWPMPELLVLVEPFHLGLSAGGLNCRRKATGVKVGLMGRGGCASGDEGVCLEILRGMELWKTLFPRRLGVTLLLRALTDDAEELRGVSRRLLVMDCSEDNMVLMESRNCWFLILTFMSSSVLSSSRISVFNLAQVRFMSY